MMLITGTCTRLPLICAAFVSLVAFLRQSEVVSQPTLSNDDLNRPESSAIDLSLFYDKRKTLPFSGGLYGKRSIPYSGGLYGKRATAIFSGGRYDKRKSIPFSGGMYGKRALASTNANLLQTNPGIDEDMITYFSPFVIGKMYCEPAYAKQRDVPFSGGMYG